MMEKVVSFLNRQNQRLYGILHLPEPNARSRLKGNVGVNLLNPGLKTRVAPNRLNVKLARRLARQGFFVLRFDPFGIGDSDGELSEGNASLMALWAKIQHGVFVDDTIAGNDFFVGEAKLAALVLIGQCGAGITAALSGTRDARVHNLVMIDTPFRYVTAELEVSRALLESYTPGSMIKEQVSGLFSPKKIADNLGKLTSPSFFCRKAKTLASIAYLACKPRSGQNLSERFNHDLANSLMALGRSGRGLYFLFAENDFSLREFQADFYPNFLDGNKKVGLNYNLTIIKNANHVYSDELWQEELIGNIESWLNDKYVCGKNSVA